MLAYKGFQKGLVCRGYQFHIGETHTEKEANCAQNGFHCATNPLDCLSYYPNFQNSTYCVVEADGDIDEDATDSKVACTVMRIVQVLKPEEYLLHIIKYLAANKHERDKGMVKRERGDATNTGYVIVVGKEPRARGAVGDWIAMLKVDHKGAPVAVSICEVDGERIKAGTYYDVYGGMEDDQ